jgi:hypothetical protein
MLRLNEVQIDASGRYDRRAQREHDVDHHAAILDLDGDGSFHHRNAATSDPHAFDQAAPFVSADD